MHNYDVPPIYKNPRFLKFVKSIIDDDPVSYGRLDRSTKETLVNQLVDYLGDSFRDDLFDMLADNPRIMMHHLTKYMTTGRREYALDLAESLSDALYTYFDPILKGIYNDMLDIYEADHRNEMLDRYQKRVVVDPKNGELRIL